MIRSLSVAIVLAMGATAYAQGIGGEAAIKERQAAMKAISGANKTLVTMARGRIDFDATKAAAAFNTIAAAAEKSKAYYTDDSKTGETRALPIVWQQKSDFLKRFDTMIKDAKAGASNSQNMTSFAAAQKTLVGNCGGCHKVYRKPED